MEGVALLMWFYSLETLVTSAPHIRRVHPAIPNDCNILRLVFWSSLKYYRVQRGWWGFKNFEGSFKLLLYARDNGVLQLFSLCIE